VREYQFIPSAEPWHASRACAVPLGGGAPRQNLPVRGLAAGERDGICGRNHQRPLQFTGPMPHSERKTIGSAVETGRGASNCFLCGLQMRPDPISIGC